MRTGGKILTDIPENHSPDVTTQDIISKHLSESAQNLFTRLQGRGRKRKRVTTSRAKASKKRKRSASKSKPQSKQKRSRKPKNAKKQIKRDFLIT
jgi:hypothetical protein